MTITPRQAIDVNQEVQCSKSWILFTEFIKEHKAFHHQEVQNYSEDLTKLLVREQHMGAEEALKKLMENFTIYVRNNTTTE